jgi:ABC-type bacteriocin/lantibiotic exporter with double-glycine peptidase domain
LFLNYPFVKQNDLKDCGVACLTMIIKYYKGYISPEILRDMTNTNRNGTTAYDIVKTANEIGFEAIGVKTDLNKNNKLVLPCIAHVMIDNKYNHYVVIYKIDYKKRKLIIADPSSGIKYICFDDFLKVWSNVLLMMHPIKNIPTYKKHSIFKFILELLAINRSLVNSIYALSVLITSFTIISSFFLQILLLAINQDNPINRVVIIALAFAFIEVVKTISDYLRNKVLIFLNQKIDLMLTTETYKNILTLPYKYYRNHTTGEILSKVNDLSIIRTVISKISLTIFIDTVLTLAIAIVLYLISYQLFLIAMILFITYILSIIIFKDIINKYVMQLQKEKANVGSYLVESIDGFETIKGLDIKKHFIKSFEQKYIVFLEKIFKFERLHNRQYLVKQLLNNLGIIIINTIGILMVINNEITIGELLTFHMLFNYFIYPVSSYSELYSDIKEAQNALDRILDLNVIKENSGFVDDIQLTDISIKHLNFEYHSDKIFLKNICLDIKKGEKLIITGHSGSGKSTILKIIKNYYKINRGMLYINDIDINDFKEELLDSNIIYISQSETLFTNTVINNINLDRTRDNVEILELIKLFRIDKIFTNYLGYNTLLEENGFNISGGEKQRIILARSFIEKKPIILIDEGFSQMDTNLERTILKELFEKYKSITIIITSHRLDNLDLFDHLVEINNGVIVKDVLKNG